MFGAQNSSSSCPAAATAAVQLPTRVAALVMLLAVQCGGVDVAQGIQIQNLLRNRMEVFWVDRTNRVPLGFVEGGGIFATNSYVGHTFAFEYDGAEQGRVVVTSSSTWYVLKDEGSEKRYPELWENSGMRSAFEYEYFEETGRLWYGFWPKEPSTLPMWNASKVGDTWTIEDEEDECTEDEVPFKQEVTILSTSPKVILAKDFLSHDEADEIINLAKPKMVRSTTGTGDNARADTTRTSQQTFLPKTHDVVIKIYAKVAKLLNIDKDIVMKQSEDLQVVHYDVGQEYKAHHDWGKEKVTRFATVLLYLNDQASPAAGGETHFVKADLKVHPGKGSAVLFYNLLEDGSADDRSLHAALAVREGEKYICNVWLRDYQ
eukprot:gene12250-9338_t